MTQAGCHTMWNGIIDDNLASRRAHGAAGFRPILRLKAVHEPPPASILAWPADYADERLVEQARRLLGDEWVHIADQRWLTADVRSEAQDGVADGELAAGRRL